MAYAYPITDEIIGYNLDAPEELLFLAAFRGAERHVSNARWLRRLRDNSIDDDKGISSDALNAFNSHLRAHRAPHLVLVLRPTALTSFMRLRGEDKVMRRRTLLQVLAEGGAPMLARARADLASLPQIEDPELLDYQRTLFAVGRPRLVTGLAASAAGIAEAARNAAARYSGAGARAGLEDLLRDAERRVAEAEVAVARERTRAEAAEAAAQEAQTRVEAAEALLLRLAEAMRHASREIADAAALAFKPPGRT